MIGAGIGVPGHYDNVGFTDFHTRDLPGDSSLRKTCDLWLVVEFVNTVFGECLLV